MPVAILDEFARNTRALTCQHEDVRPLIYRSVGVSATPSSFVAENLNSINSTNTQNYARAMLAPRGIDYDLSKPMGEWNAERASSRTSKSGAYMLRFVASDALRLLRVRLARDAAAMMPPAVEARFTEHPLAPPTASRAHADIRAILVRSRAAAQVFNVKVTHRPLAVTLGMRDNDLCRCTFAEMCDKMRLSPPDIEPQDADARFRGSYAVGDLARFARARS